jgi:F-type H+-transporting ATPase subunit b
MRGWLVIGVVLGLALCASAPARAQDEHKAPAEHKDAAGHKEEAAKDNVFAGFVDLLIWTIVVFLILLFVLRKWAWAPMLEGLEKREQAIASAIEDAKAARAEAAGLRQEIQAERQKANDTIRQMFDKARQDATRLSEEFRAQAMADVQAERERLRREVEVARDQALHDIYTQGAHLATLISSKAIRRHLTEEDHRQLIDEALAELRQAYRRNGQG